MLAVAQPLMLDSKMMKVGLTGVFDDFGKAKGKALKQKKLKCAHEKLSTLLKDPNRKCKCYIEWDGSDG